MNRKKFGLLAFAFVVVVGVMEVLALQLGSLEFPLPSGPGQSAVADDPGTG